VWEQAKKDGADSIPTFFDQEGHLIKPSDLNDERGVIGPTLVAMLDEIRRVRSLMGPSNPLSRAAALFHRCETFYWLAATATIRSQSWRRFTGPSEMRSMRLSART